MAVASKSNGKKKTKRFTTPVFRLSFPNLFTARRSDEDDPNSKPKFGCSAVWTPAKFTPREKELWRSIIGELNRVSKEAFKKEWKNLPDNIKRGLRDGAAKDGMEGYGEGTRFANLTTKDRPGVVAKDGVTKIGPEFGNADEIYPGCYVRATVNVYSYGTKPGSKGKGVAIGLFNIQKIKDGPRLDSRVAPEDDFDEDIDSAWMDEEDDFDGEGDDADDSNDGDEDDFE